MAGDLFVESLLPYILGWFWTMCAIFSAVIARSHGRIWLVWFVVGLTCGPFGLLVGVMRTPKKPDNWGV